ncbi:WD40-repeat-containing domain protein [Mycena olivaceomarginata]|nr:WD40-repeat-containing domain protein [Mycena olivaceomarginata]
MDSPDRWHSGWVLSVAFSREGACVVSGSGDKTMRIWDVTMGAKMTKMEGHSDGVLSVAFSPDGARIVSGSRDKTVRIWDATTGAEVPKMEGHNDSVCDNIVRIWDATTGAEVTKMEGHSDSVWSVAFSLDGARVVSGSGDKAMEGHRDGVLSVAFSPDGTWIVSGSGDETVRIWDATTCAEVTKMERHSWSVWSVAFSPDVAHAMSGSRDKTMQFVRAAAPQAIVHLNSGSLNVRQPLPSRFGANSEAGSSSVTPIVPGEVGCNGPFAPQDLSYARGPSVSYARRYAPVCIDPWSSVHFRLPNSQTTYNATRSQIPLIPAFAFTSHNAQGRSLDVCCIDLAGYPTIHSAHILLSRLRRLKGRCILRPFGPQRIRNHISEELGTELKRTEFKAEITKAYSRERLSWFYGLVPEGQVDLLTRRTLELNVDVDAVVNLLSN